MIAEQDMKLTFMIALILLEAAVSQAVEKDELSRSQPEENEKIGLSHDVLRKRSTSQSFVAIVPGIVYHDSSDKSEQTSEQDDSLANNTQPSLFFVTKNIYTTPLPVLSKISDVLTGQGPSFQTAIANHLVAPVSVYTPKISAEVTASIPSKLEYSEKTTYQIQPVRQLNDIVKDERPNLQPRYQRLQSLIQPQITQKVQSLYSQDHNPYHLQLNIEPVNPQVIPLTHITPQYQRPWPYQTSQQLSQYIPQQLPKHPGIEYVTNEHKSVQKELELRQNPEQKPSQKPDHRIRNQGASSYASFFFDPARVPLQPQANKLITQNQQKQLHPLQPQILHQPHEPRTVIHHEAQLMPQHRKNHVERQPHTVHYTNYPLQSEIQHHPEHGKIQHQPQHGQIQNQPQYEQIQHHTEHEQNHLLYPNYRSQQNQFQQWQQYQLQHAPVTGHTHTQNQVSQSIEHHQYQIQREPLPVKPNALVYDKKILINNPTQFHFSQNFVPDLNKKYSRPEPTLSFKDLPNNYIVSLNFNQTSKKSPSFIPFPIQYIPSHREDLTFHNQVRRNKPKQALSTEESANSTLSLKHAPLHIEPRNYNYNQFAQRPGGLSIKVAPVEFHGKYAHEIFKNFQIWS